MADELLFITRKYPPSIGGMQRLNYELKSSLSKLLPVHLVAWGHSQIYLPFFLLYGFFRSVWQLITRPAISAIIVGDGLLAPWGLVLRFLFGRPVVVILHGLDLVYPNSAYQAIVIRCLRPLDAFFCNSRSTRSEALARGLSEKRCYVLPVGIDPGRFSPEAVPNPANRFSHRLQALKTGKQTLLITVSRLVERKGVAWFIENVLPGLMREYPDLRYWVVGDGPQRPAIRAAIQRCGLQDKIEILGEVSDEELRAVYRAASIFVMPNIPIDSDREGFGIVALEAAVNDLCVVASKLEGIQDAVTDGQNGLLVPPADAPAYLQVLRELLNDTDRRRKLAEQARNFTLRHCNWNAIAPSYLQIIKRLGKA